MTRAAALILMAAIAACGGSTEPAQDAAPAAGTTTPIQVTAGWMTTDGIQTPESVYYDPASGFIFTSQIDGAPDGRDGNGRIVKLNGDGSVADGGFVTGLNAPKGLRACGGTLWTADINEVIAIDVATGDVTGRTTIADAVFLNDVACDGATAYITDMMANRVYAVTDGVASVVAEGMLEFPNGLLVDGTRLIIGGWGSQPKADFSTDVAGHLFSYDMVTKQKTLITPEPTANIDGLESDGNGGYLVSDYMSGRLLHISATGESRLLRQFMPGAADIAFVPASGIVLVPHMNENMVAAYDVSADLR